MQISETKPMNGQVINLDVLKVYPEGDRLYFGRKWGVASFQLSNGQAGLIDFPIPRDADDVKPVAIGAVRQQVARGNFG